MPVEPKAELWRRDTTPGLLVVIFGVAFFGFVALVVAGLTVPAFVTVDRAISDAVRSFESPSLDMLARGLTRLGDMAVMFGLSTVLVVWLAATRRKAEAVLFVATIGLGTALGSLFKDVFGRLRPGLDIARIPLPDSYSFPSGHALASFLFFGTLVFLVLGESTRLSVRVSVSAVCVVLAVGVAMSRVYLGVHWFGDIVASWLLGAAWMAVTIGSYWWFTRDQVT